jgi:hypothetical protein
MVLHAVPTLGDSAEPIEDGVGNHGAGKTVFFDEGKVDGVQQVNGDEPHVFAGGAKVVQGDTFITPAAHAVMDIAL